MCAPRDERGGATTRKGLPGWVLPLLLAGGCQAPAPIPAEVRWDLQARVERAFERVILAKPEDAAAARHPLAPLILVEHSGAHTRPALPTQLWSWTNAAHWSGARVKQVVFVWQSAARTQGVRLTLDAEGRPVVWEVLRARSGARVVYVGQSLEAEAMRQHAAPLAGRRFWIEPAEPVEQVIARVLEETTVPMGPMLYLEAATGEVSTIICRCMPAQAGEVMATRSYAIREVPAEAWGSLPGSVRRGAADWSPVGQPRDVSFRLRLKRD